MTLTTQVQPVGACTTKVCAPRDDCDVTDCPDAPVSLIAGVPAADDPAGVTDTWKEGPEAGAGAQLKAQPMFQPAAVVVKEGLVQFPDICVGPRSTRAGPAAAVVVDPPAAAVVVDPPGAVVVVLDDPPALVVADPLAGAVVVVADPPEVGSLYAGAPPVEDAVAEPSVVPFSAKPITSAKPAATRSCHVAQLRFPFMWSSPGAGMMSSRVPGGGGSDMAKRWPEIRLPSRQRLHRSSLGHGWSVAEVTFCVQLVNWDEIRVGAA